MNHRDRINKIENALQISENGDKGEFKKAVEKAVLETDGIVVRTPADIAAAPNYVNAIAEIMANYRKQFQND